MEINVGFQRDLEQQKEIDRCEVYNEIREKDVGVTNE